VNNKDEIDGDTAKHERVDDDDIANDEKVKVNEIVTNDIVVEKKALDKDDDIKDHDVVNDKSGGVEEKTKEIVNDKDDINDGSLEHERAEREEINNNNDDIAKVGKAKYKAEIQDDIANDKKVGVINDKVKEILWNTKK